VTRDVVLKLDEFGRHALATFARERRRSHSVAVRTASLYYLADRDAQRLTWPVPPFVKRTRIGNTVTVRIKLDDETWEAVVQEAERQRVSAERLVEHAILYFLANFDSGRIAGRLDEVLGDATGPRQAARRPPR
jgi:hypothetical protein